MDNIFWVCSSIIWSPSGIGFWPSLIMFPLWASQNGGDANDNTGDYNDENTVGDDTGKWYTTAEDNANNDMELTDEYELGTGIKVKGNIVEIEKEYIGAATSYAITLPSSLWSPTPTNTC